MMPAFALILLLFLLLVWQVHAGGTLVTLDGALNAGLAPLRSKLALAGFGWLTQIGTGAAGTIVALVASGLFWSDGRNRLILPIWVAFLGAQTTTWSLKFVTHRARPPFLDGVTAASPSFPSAHATVSTAIYGFIALAVAAGLEPGQRWTVYAAAAALILLIWFSRLFLSLHYLTDVAAGGLVGLFWLLLGWRMARM